MEEFEKPKVLFKFFTDWVDIHASRRPGWEPSSLEITAGFYPNGVNLGRKLYLQLGFWRYDLYFQVGKTERP